MKNYKVVTMCVFVASLGYWGSAPNIQAAGAPSTSSDTQGSYQLQNDYDSLVEQLKQLEIALQKNEESYNVMESKISKLRNDYSKSKVQAEHDREFINDNKNRASYIKDHNAFIRYFDYLFHTSDDSFLNRIPKGFSQIKSDNELIKKYNSIQKQLSQKQKFIKQTKTSLKELEMELQGNQEVIDEQKGTQQSLTQELQEKEQELKNANVQTKPLNPDKKNDPSIGDFDSGYLKAIEMPIHSGSFTFPTVGNIIAGVGYGGVWDKGITISNSSKSVIPVIAVADGVVIKSLFSTTDGNVIQIQHSIDSNQFETVYSHLNTRMVKVGDHVAKGDYLGTMGSTGNAEQKQLYFEILQQKGDTLEPINPLLYIPAN
ncbi:peptidoglycan DD-metalloendopeptidase family protein [Bacillus sp. BRMEA1]|uniref:murein hydrolase activator EnvC family protein n=1 Tax=Neobacillus endophyticus TaxID=2738405 RepID=UPI001563B185|nr:M23 family metallopeptidase [Neobacillus endophyticus]NRD81029.1 peptidoglycan DD-metalloendopeptidase family protein [Neobacillus endophyticus]